MYDSKETLEKIRALLVPAFGEQVMLDDQSRFHVGHRAAGGGGHFFAEIRSDKFNGLSPLARQRLVLEVVKPLMDREIHAFTMKCLPLE